MIADTLQTVSNKNADLFSVASAHAYTCATQSVQLETLPDGVKEIQIDFTQSKVAAFMDHTKGQWDSGRRCVCVAISDAFVDHLFGVFCAQKSTASPPKSVMWCL